MTIFSKNVLYKFSNHFILISMNKFELVQVCLDLFRNVRNCLELFRPVQTYSDLFRSVQTCLGKMIWKHRQYIFWENCHLFHQKNYIKYWRIIVCHSFFRDIVLFFTYWKRGYCTVSIQYWRKKNTWGEIENWFATRYLKKEDFV